MRNELGDAPPARALTDAEHHDAFLSGEVCLDGGLGWVHRRVAIRDQNTYIRYTRPVSISPLKS